MLYSPEHRFLFVHVSKTGGSSIERALIPLCPQPALNKIDKALSKARLHWDYKRHHFKQHDSINVAKRVLPVSEFNDIYKFCLVRNPWSWLVSLYFFLKRKESHRHHSLVNTLTFEEYVKFEIKRNARHQHHFFMNSKSEIIVDYLGHFEELESVFDEICQHVSIDRPVLEKKSIYKRRPYQEFYTPALIELVRNHWRKDIDALGYEFDNYKSGCIISNYNSLGLQATDAFSRPC